MRNWYWIELIGFDVNSADYGVGDFLGRVGADIEGVSFLFSNIDFVNTHKGVTGKYLTPCESSYGAHPYNEERARQSWRDTDLKGLIAGLHSRGVKVVFSCFNIFTYGLDGKMQIGEFCARHEEIRDRDCNGNPVYGVNVLKHLSDGTLYEDYLFTQINAVIADYGFDGVQIADGVSTARLSVGNGDFSDDMIRQFVEKTGDGTIKVTTKTNKEYKARREYILTNRYEDYVLFLADRWADFYKKMFATVRGLIIFNNCWTLDPFEALYRYGFDYAKVAGEKAYAVMVEENSATRPILSEEDNAGYDSTPEDSAGYHYKYMLMQMQMRACMPDKRMLPLTPIKDDAEQWDILRHNPMELYRDIIRRNNIYVYDGGLCGCMDEPFFCTSDAVPATDWQWLFKAYRDGKRSLPVAVCGYTALYSQPRVYEELSEYIATRNYTSQELHYELLRYGLDIGCMARAENAADIKSPLLIVNYAYLSEEEKTAVKASAAPIVAIGETEDLDGQTFDAGLRITVRNMEVYEGAEEDFRSIKKLYRIKQARKTDILGGLWTAPLPYNRLSETYFKALVRILSRLIGIQAPPEGVHVSKYRTGERSYRYIVSNDKHCYALPAVSHDKKIVSAVSVLKYKGYPTYFDGKTFIDRVPPRGINIVEITEEGE